VSRGAESPPAPLSYLSDLVEQVGQPEPLTYEQQHQILIQLQPALRSADPEARKGRRHVLEMFSRRDDLYADVDRTLAQLELADRLDVAARLEQAARTAQRRKALVDEMTALHQAGQWDAVVTASEELARFDPEHPDPGGIVSDAKAKIRDADLSERYGQAWQQAADLFSAIEQEQGGYRDAPGLIRQRPQLGTPTGTPRSAAALPKTDAGAGLEQARSARSVKQRRSLFEKTAVHQARRPRAYTRHATSVGGGVTAASISFGPILHERTRSGTITGAAIGAALVAGLVAAIIGPVAIAVAVGVGLFGLVAWRPVLGTYLYLAPLPLIAGMPRGALVPLFRPNEVLLVLLIAGAMAGGYIRALRGAPLQLRLRPLDVPLAAFVLLATVWPITSMLLRGVPPVAADVLAVLPVCKLAGLLLLVRTTVRTPTQVLWCIRLIIGGAVVIAAIAVVQTLGIGPVVALLRTWWPAEQAMARGTATLANAVATGDYILIGLTLLVMSGVRGLVGRRTRVGAGLVLAAGLLAAAQFSTWFGALLVGALLFRRLPARMSALRLAPIAGIAVLFGAPALLLRLKELSGDSSPQSWHIRWQNVTHLYLPELVENGRFLVGISPNSVLRPPDMWRAVVYLESGYLEFLWIGGVPLLAGFVVLSRAVFRLTRRHGSLTDGVGACAAALAIAWWIIVCLSLLDSHFFMRGPSDLIFILLGIVTGLAPARRTNDATARGGTMMLRPERGTTPWDWTAWERVARRTAGVLIAGTALLVLSPLMAIIAVVIRSTSPGPALFIQPRVGLARQPFSFYKFRSMRVGGDDAAHRELIARELHGEDTSSGGSMKLDGDSRITRFGGFLRRTSLDELPQLINVVRGDMALVGPRPCLEWEAEMFPREFDERFAVRPGVTGLWQVSGRNTVSTLNMLRLDVYYARHQTVRGDVAILARTLPAVLRRDGAR
jgi:lipopolysaccharide/colanic/teichoic acid biosynthesis glycosyltransferase